MRAEKLCHLGMVVFDGQSARRDSDAIRQRHDSFAEILPAKLRGHFFPAHVFASDALCFALRNRGNVLSVKLIVRRVEH